MFKPKANILYVDDEYYNLTAFRAAFRAYYNIYTSLSARAAMDILKKQPIDLIITDQRMPEMTGIQFLEALLSEYPDPVRMILTGFTDVAVIKKAINNGYVLRYITKPWNEKELKQIIDMGIKIHELEQNQRLLIDKLEDGLKQKKKAIDVFRKYVKGDIIDQILKLGPGQALTSSGEHRIISILFADIREFMKLYSTFEANDTLTYLNKYFAAMINCVVKNHGSIYKLVGDKLLATFGAETASMTNQKNAVFCALDMMEELKKFNQEHAQEFNHETIIGIGVATGPVIVGHLISEHKLDHVTVGKPIQDAIRIEELTHKIPNGILIDETTYKEIANDIEAEMLPRKSQDPSEKIYRVIARKKKG